MVSIKFAAGLLLSFLLAFQTLVSAHADPQGRRTKVSWVRANIGNIASVEKAKVVVDGRTASVVGNRGLGGGRKLMAAHVIMMQEKGLKSTEETTESKGSESSSTNSSRKTGATHSDHDQKKLKVHVDGFVAFRADYHVPKHHPPRNN